jgi:AcrR family transcriptional regulator
MARWEPNTQERLVRAALDLFSERGFERTTVAEISKRAGLTERTFFRHFADKREVLFGGSQALETVIVTAVAEAPAPMSPLEAAAAGFEAAGREFFVADRRGFSRRRQAVIAANPELQEREVAKLASLSAAVAGALRGRGVVEPAATLTAGIASAIFYSAFERWIARGSKRDFAELVREAVRDVRTLTAAA